MAIGEGTNSVSHAKNGGNDVASRNPRKFQTRTEFGPGTVEQALFGFTCTLTCSATTPRGWSLEKSGRVVPLLRSHTSKPVSQLAQHYLCFSDIKQFSLEGYNWPTSAILAHSSKNKRRRKNPLDMPNLANWVSWSQWLSDSRVFKHFLVQSHSKKYIWQHNSVQVHLCTCTHTSETNVSQNSIYCM